MRQRMVVLDVTRMHGERICVGGYLEDGTAIRPVCGRSGPTEAWLHTQEGSLVVPFAVVELFVGTAPRIEAPHTEDRNVPDRGHRVIEVLQVDDQLQWLTKSSFNSVHEIFGSEIQRDNESQWGRYVQAGSGARSLGTIRAPWVSAVSYRHYPERHRWDYRLRFGDESGEEFQLAVVDLAFRRRLDALRDRGLAPDAVARVVLDELRKQKVFLRIGLARGWEKHPDRCYVQITGVYGFGDG